MSKVNNLISASCLNFEDIYYLPFSNFFIKNLLNFLSPTNLADIMDYTFKNLARLCNHQKSS